MQEEKKKSKKKKERPRSSSFAAARRRKKKTEGGRPTPTCVRGNTNRKKRKKRKDLGERKGKEKGFGNIILPTTSWPGKQRIGRKNREEGGSLSLENREKEERPPLSSSARTGEGKKD